MFHLVAELYALLLTDILVLVERHEERDKFYLRCYTVEGMGGMKEELSPVIRLKDCLLRSAAADKGPTIELLCVFLDMRVMVVQCTFEHATYYVREYPLQLIVCIALLIALHRRKNISDSQQQLSDEVGTDV